MSSRSALLSLFYPFILKAHSIESSREQTRIQNQDFESKLGGVAVVRDLIRNEGLTAFFKGFTPKVLVVGPKLIFSLFVTTFFPSWL